MENDSVARAREALQRAQRAIPPESENAHLLEAVAEIAAALERLEGPQAAQDAEVVRNLAVQQALLDARLLRVETNRFVVALNRIIAFGPNLYRRAKAAVESRPLHRLRPGGPRQERALHRAYATWVAHELAGLPSPNQARLMSEKWIRIPRISVIMAVRNGKWISEALHSLEIQTYRNWELCIAVSPACESKVLPYIRDFEAACGPVRNLIRGAADEAAGWNAAAGAASGEYLVTVEESGVLSRFALHYVVEALQEGTFDVLYSDEDSLDFERRRERPVFKPDWSPDLLTSGMYPGHLLTIRRERFPPCGDLYRQDTRGYLLDLIVGLSKGPLRVRHIPRVLYHSVQPASTPPLSGGAKSAETRGRPSIRHDGTAGEMTAIVCSRSAALAQECIRSLQGTAAKAVRQIIVVAHEEFGPNLSLRSAIERAGATALPYSGSFDFSSMNNLGARMAEAPNLLFLNDDVKANGRDWAEMLIENVSRPEIGVVGSVLWYPSGGLQHAGIVVGVGDGVGHVGRHMRSSSLWPWLLATRNVSAVTGACLAIRREVFDQLGGFDPAFPISYGDVDLCFRARAREYRVICVPAPGLVHAECQSRPGVTTFEERYRFYARWADTLRKPDPYYSISLTPSEKIALNLTNEQWYRPLLAV